MVEKRPQSLNSVTPTDSAQRLRVEEAAKTVGGVEKLEAAGFFELTGIDPDIRTRNTPASYQELAEIALDRMMELRKN